MRRKLIIAATAGALTLSGVAVAVPALADDGGPGSSAVERITDALAGLVSDGTITEAQADEVAAALSEAGIGHRGGPGAGPFHGGPDLDAAATALGMTEDELRAALRADDGATLADIAEVRGVPVAQLVDALVAAAEERIADAVEDGRLTSEQADEWLAELEDRITDRVTSGGPAPGAHGPRGPWGGGHDRSHDAGEPTPGD